MSDMSMSADAQQILTSALGLPPVERAAVAEKLLSSLDRIDPRLEELWAEEIRDRLAAIESGEMKMIPAEEVFAEFDEL